MRRTALQASVSGGSEKRWKWISTVPKQDRHPIPRDPQGMSKGPGASTAREGVQSPDFLSPWFLASCSSPHHCWALLFAGIAGGLLLLGQGWHHKHWTSAPG